MRQRRGVIVVLLIAGIIYPQVALAAWWNPVSWFRSSPPLQESTSLEDENDSTDSKNEIKEVVGNQEESRGDKNDEYLLNQITILQRENAELRTRLNSCQIPATTNDVANTVKVISTTELDKQNKLKKIDQEILTLIDNQLNGLVITDEERCGYLLDRINKYKFGTSTLAYKEYEANCNVKPEDVSMINELLAAYRLVDSKMTYVDINASFDELKKLKNYLINTYIKYR